MKSGKNDYKRIDVSYRNCLNSSSVSKGNQIKWFKDDKYIKLDCLGYESIAEVMVTKLLQFTNMKKIEYVTYYSCDIYQGNTYMCKGCYSCNYVPHGCEEVSIGDLLRGNLKSFAIKFDELRDFVLDVTKLDIKSYLDKILCLDAITKNEDRHFDNISFILNKGIYQVAPIFDNGASCLSDVISYSLSTNMEEHLRCLHAKPFSIDFKRQIGFVDRILIDCDGFFSSIEVSTEEEKRALEVIKYGLDEMEGIAWERY